jgi:hypothetical protein
MRSFFSGRLAVLFAQKMLIITWTVLSRGIYISQQYWSVTHHVWLHGIQAYSSPHPFSSKCQSHVTVHTHLCIHSSCGHIHHLLLYIHLSRVIVHTFTICYCKHCNYSSPVIVHTGAWLLASVDGLGVERCLPHYSLVQALVFWHWHFIIHRPVLHVQA